MNVSGQLLRQRQGWWSHERVVYWAGVETETAWLVTTVIRPRARTTWGSFQTSVKANAEVVASLSSAGLGILAQVHTHPGAFVNHSEGDDEMAVVAFENFVSIVVPHYGRKGMLPLTKCGVHRFENRGFRRLRPEEIAASMRVVSTLIDFEATA